MKHGDFSDLAEQYARWRPGYAPFVRDAFINLLPGGGGVKRPLIADIGAGTGIWSRALADQGYDIIAIEPNDAMRAQGTRLSTGKPIEWRKGSAEATGLANESVDAVCMASAFHWADFDRAVAEFHRILKPGGLFMALWNPRHIESSPLLVEIEAGLKQLVPELKRVSTGKSDFCNSLQDRLRASGNFGDVLYLEGRHSERQTPERYIGLWESVNDVRVQAGEERFAKFMDLVRDKVNGLDQIEAEYQTRAWIARKMK